MDRDFSNSKLNNSLYYYKFVNFKIKINIPLVLVQGSDHLGHIESESLGLQDDPTDCLSDRKTALSDVYNLYLPECTPDGRYQKVSKKFSVNLAQYF